MSSPSGPPWLQPDPWAEQERRRQAHERRRRRRRVAWIAPVVVVAFVAASSLYLIEGDASLQGERAATTDSGATSTVAPTTAESVILPPPSTLAPGAVVRLDEVWLLDRQDGTYDWGLIVTSTDDFDREGVVVTARLVGAGGEVVAEVGDEIGVLPAGERAAVGGVVADPSGPPARIEADVAVGRRAAGTEDGSLEVVAVERRPDARDGGGEVLTGRLSSTFAAEVEAVRVAAIWRDDEGVVVTAAFRDVERVRPRVEARFEVPLDGLVVPDGLPAEVLVIR